MIDKLNNNPSETYQTSAFEEEILDELACLDNLSIPTLQRAFLLLTRHFFSNPTAYFSITQRGFAENLQRYLYVDPVINPELYEEMKDTCDSILDIQIANEFEDAADKMEIRPVEHLPKIIIDVPAIQYQEPGIVNLFSGLTADRSGYGQSIMCKATIEFAVHARRQGDAVTLSNLVAQQFIGLRYYLMNKLHLMAYMPQQVTKAEILDVENATKTFVSKFSLEITWQQNFVSKVESVRLAKISISPRRIEK